MINLNQFNFEGMIMLFGNASELTAAAKMFISSLEEAISESGKINQKLAEGEHRHLYHAAQKLCFVNKHALSFAFLGELESVAKWDYNIPVTYQVTDRGVMIQTPKGSFEVWSPALSMDNFKFVTPLTSTERPLRLN